MASPRVVTSAETDGTTAATNIAINLPGSLVSGNVLVVLARKGTGTQTTPAGWNELLNSSADASDDNTLIMWRKSNGAEGATVTINGSASAKFSGASWQITDCADPVAGPVLPPKINTEVTGTSTAPDSGNLNVASAVPEWPIFAHLFGTLGGWEGEQTDPPTYPANYTHGQAAGQSGTAGVAATNNRVAGGWFQKTAISDDAAAFTISASDDWSASTVAVPGVLRHLQSLTDDTDTTTYTTAAFTPYAGELLIVMVGASNTANSAVSNSDGITFTQIADIVINSDNHAELWIADSFAAAVSQTITVDCTGDPSTSMIIMVAGAHAMFRSGASAIKQSATASGLAAATPAVTFGAAVSQDNPTIAFLYAGNNPANVTPPTGWIEEQDIGTGTTVRGCEYATRGRAFASTTVTWGSTSPGNWAAICIELDISAVPGTGVPNSLMMMGCGI